MDPDTSSQACFPDQRKLSNPGLSVISALQCLELVLFVNPIENEFIKSSLRRQSPLFQEYNQPGKGSMRISAAPPSSSSENVCSSASGSNQILLDLDMATEQRRFMERKAEREIIEARRDEDLYLFADITESVPYRFKVYQQTIKNPNTSTESAESSISSAEPSRDREPQSMFEGDITDSFFLSPAPSPALRIRPFAVFVENEIPEPEVTSPDTGAEGELTNTNSGNTIEELGGESEDIPESEAATEVPIESHGGGSASEDNTERSLVLWKGKGCETGALQEIDYQWAYDFTLQAATQIFDSGIDYFDAVERKRILMGEGDGESPGRVHRHVWWARRPHVRWFGEDHCPARVSQADSTFCFVCGENFGSSGGYQVGCEWNLAIMSARSTAGKL